MWLLIVSLGLLAIILIARFDATMPGWLRATLMVATVIILAAATVLALAVLGTTT